MAVIHVMADGTVLADISGKAVTVNPKTDMAYRVIGQILQRIGSSTKAEAVNS